MADNYDFSTTVFENAYNNALAEGTKLKKEANLRRWGAYVLKGVAIFGGIAVSTGLKENIAQIVGVVIVVAIASDTLLSNHLRLVVMTEAANAYSNLFYKIAANYNNKMIKIESLRNQGKHQQAYEELVELNQEYNTLIYDNTRIIKEKVQQADLAFLKNLALDKDRNNVKLME